MISNFIVVSSFVLALIFTIVWLARPNLRRRIEEPKHDFLRRVQRYNRQIDDVSEDKDGACR